jgi:ABC-type Fe3+-citrate transport system substrate-binding protein
MNADDLEQARINPDFLKFLDEKEATAVQEDSLEQMYEVLDNLLILDLDDHDRINKLYEKILSTAFENIEERLFGGSKLNVNTDDIYYIRAFYEHAIEKWSNENYQGAKELFFILGHIIDDTKIVKSMRMHLIAVAKGINLDTFHNDFVSKIQMETDDIYGYFIVNFEVDYKDYMGQHKQLMSDLIDELGHML